MKELTSYERWQMERYGNILPDINHTPDEEMYESGIEELDRWADWMEYKAEGELYQFEKE